METLDILTPKETPKLTNHDILFGKPIAPNQRLGILSDDEFEDIVTEWIFEYLKSKYTSIRRCGGAGDKGRDIIAWIDERGGKWDNYQCKHYGSKLTPTNFYVELGKLCYYTQKEDFTIPEKYYIVTREGVGTTLGDMIDNPEDLKSALIDNWEVYVEKKITSKVAVKLEGELKNYVENFDFSIVEAIEPHVFIEQFKTTSFYWYRFGGQIQKYRKDIVVPEIVDSEIKMRYIQQLLIAYSEEISTEINSIEELKKHGIYKFHFDLQRANFYSIETLKQFERDNLPPDSEAFESFKNEVLTAVYPKILNVYENAFRRLQSVLEHSNLIALSSNPLSVTLSVMDRNGICHHLVNENKLSWKL
ncbi:ABC-three component system protein [Chryseobacterium sp.]|uniref:ABC-three component system protein n=1 Tax=Chryseobacterium sp. TaxID=1871047 RepID=UPI000ED8CFE3|nr:ABC-three component system protein [Chryseobacterium sp.]HCA08111.1 hypothetical protein [Chryseobacterium sp.]